MRTSLTLQAKVILILIAVILPTFLIVTIAENKFTQPILEEEIRQIGINAAKTLASEIDSARLLALPNPTDAIESHIQDLLYTQPNIIRMDVTVRAPLTGAPINIASNIEEEPGTINPAYPLVEVLSTAFLQDEAGSGAWDIHLPIEHRSRDTKGPKKITGAVHVLISTKLVGKIVGTIWKTTATAAAFSVVTLIFALSYFLRKTITNDRLLRKAETHNLQLTQQLHETQRQLMNSEKFAVMGQLTASFAHEIGTPLNAIGGHLQLLKDEVDHPQQRAISAADRLEIINSQVEKIEEIVKGFLQSTSKPSSQKQLVDLNRLADKTIGIVGPRAAAMDIEVRRDFDRQMGPLRMVPLDLEQILLNLLNNSLDSLDAKIQGRERSSKLQIEIFTRPTIIAGLEWAEITIYDTGEGIKKADLKNVLKPFFTTKKPEEGTGLGLTICQQLAHKYGGRLELDSKEGAWTRVVVRIPYEANG